MRVRVLGNLSLLPVEIQKLAMYMYNNECCDVSES